MPCKEIAVLWDMDGVIVDTSKFHFRSWRETWAEHGVDFTEADFKISFGKRNDEIIRDVLGKKFNQKIYEAITQKKEASFRRLVKGKIKALPGAVELLSSVYSAGILQALVSSTPSENIDMIIGGLKLARYFKTIISGYDVTEGKPNPQGYLLAAKRLGINPSCCAVIEDAIAGVDAAKNGGMKCIAITTTHPPAKLKAADLIVDSLEKVNVSVIKKLLR
jgi:beta-phosphoglucomutase